jgi:1-aminocyclopropane-1-carboxylate deaminase/D-cysteine desulfhydrase-like pyridoxal-dependent ACC family enzyme
MPPLFETGVKTKTLATFGGAFSNHLAATAAAGLFSQIRLNRITVL